MISIPFGEYRNDLVVAQSDTAELRVYAYDPDNVPRVEDVVVGAEYTIRPPNYGEVSGQTTVGDFVIPADIEDDGAAVASFGETDEVGRYIAVCQFQMESGERRSVRRVFTVEDPFSVEPNTPYEEIAEAVWLRLEDCFDSTEGGPWLRDVTLRFFNKNKLVPLIDGALLDINLAPPQTNVTILDFTGITTVVVGGQEVEQVDPDQNVLVQASLLAVIRHLMRSYVEQPTPQGAQVVYEDRTQYLQRWQLIYQMENEYFVKILALWKRQYLGLGRTALLVHSKAGRLSNVAPRSWQVRRGYW